MEPATQAASLSSRPSSQTHTQSYTGPLSLVTTLFFMMGLITCLNDVLIPHLKSVYTLNYVQAMLVQFCFFGAYFIVSVPAGMLVRKLGYQNGAAAGFLLAAAGAALFYPAATSGYAFFLFAFFVLASGITILQVAANPYVTVLGDPRTASSRLTLTQAFNSLGTTIAPLLGGMLILSGTVLSHEDIARLPAAEQAVYRANEIATVQMPYLVLAGVMVALAVLFAMARMPQIVHADAAGAQGHDSLFKHRNLVLGTIGIFCYVGAEVSIGSFLINFLGEPDVAGLSHADAAKYVSYYWGGAMVGRFIGFAAMRSISPGKALAFNAVAAVLLVLLAIYGKGHVAMWAIVAIGLCNSIMFPTIFSIAVHQLGRLTGQASGVLCMAIVGGALVPFLQGFLADSFGLRVSFFLPIVCYAFIIFFGLRYAGIYTKVESV